MTTTDDDPPNREELRPIRLEAMFGKPKDDDDDDENPEPANKRAKRTDNNDDNDEKAVIDLLDDDDGSGGRVEDASAPAVADPSPAAVEPKKSAPLKVVDLLFDDSSEDETTTASSRRKQQAPTHANKTAKAAPAKKASSSSSSSKTAVQKSSGSDNNDDNAFQVASYNLWFGPQRDGNPHAQARMQAVADLLLTRTDPPCYFMAFQEVVYALDEALFPLLESVGYQMIRQPLGNPMFDPYGVALAVHPSLTVLEGGWKPYPKTRMDRGFVYARCRLPHHSDVTCLVTSTHLESWAGKEQDGSALRRVQLNGMEAYCNAQIENKRADVAIMMGDLNWDDTSRNPTDPVLDDVLSSVEWKDAWMETNHLRDTAEARKGYTYDPKLNPMMGGSLRRRFDRCLVRSAQSAPTDIVATTLLGQDALPGLTFAKENPYTKAVRQTATAPSDHFCLVTQIRTAVSSSSTSAKQG